MSHWGLCRNTEVRGIQTFPSLLRPRGVLHYFHFTNNLRTVVQDAGSGGATERASFQNRETDISLSLARDQVYISVSDPWQEEKGEKLSARWDHWKWRCHVKWWLSCCCAIVVNLHNTVRQLVFPLGFSWAMELNLDFINSVSDMQDWKKLLSDTSLLHYYYCKSVNETNMEFLITCWKTPCIYSLSVTFIHVFLTLTWCLACLNST